MGGYQNALNRQTESIASGPAKILTKTFTLTSAQILAIGATPVEILPAPGANKAYSVIALYAHYRAGSTPYGLNGGTVIDLFGTLGSANPNASIATGAFIDQTTDRYQQGTASGGALSSLAAGVVNQPLNALGDASPITGNGTLTLTIQYTIFDVTQLV